MDDEMKLQITKALEHAMEFGSMESMATAFGFMKGVLENGEPALTQIRKMDEILYIWKSLKSSQ